MPARSQTSSDVLAKMTTEVDRDGMGVIVHTIRQTKKGGVLEQGKPNPKVRAQFEKAIIPRRRWQWRVSQDPHPPTDGGNKGCHLDLHKGRCRGSYKEESWGGRTRHYGVVALPNSFEGYPFGAGKTNRANGPCPSRAWPHSHRVGELPSENQGLLGMMLQMLRLRA